MIEAAVRTCGKCGRASLGEFVEGKDCRQCWLYLNDPRYRLLFDRGEGEGEGATLAPPRTRVRPPRINIQDLAELRKG